MSILVNNKTKLVVQGITGREGSFHALRCKNYGTNLVAGVTPGQGGNKFDETVPIFDTVEEAVRMTGANTSLIFVPPPFAIEAISESIDSGIEVIACITEGVPALDSLKIYNYLQNSPSILVGPNCPGMISPNDHCKVGIMPGSIHLPGRIGVVSRSGTLTYEAVGQLSNLGIGQSTCVGIGGDSITGTSFIDMLEMFEKDDDTDAVVLIGEIGGTKEQEAAEYIKTNFHKPIFGLIVGASAPRGKRMGHAGAIITGKSARASEKVKALSSAGVEIIPTTSDIGNTVKYSLKL
ncbi:MAG: succinate--CoA ligase subunit alpha [SAR202 cluster bacterium]|nr:succinate--CoA ligase subunit alpha [Chloroflexota bacterium]MQG50931.1 succinate--CoA ligase subunit alpha [SAR202 cluster bacterium]|tara:strand:+ start:192 stop:1070 length:879 start_codon:yes stop_codon:yes gene_type:complete